MGAGSVVPPTGTTFSSFITGTVFSGETFFVSSAVTVAVGFLLCFLNRPTKRLAMFYFPAGFEAVDYWAYGCGG